jgi:putative DNA primase/helicase
MAETPGVLPKPKDQDSLLKWALFYASLGWPVFPCAPKDKFPIVDGGLYDATTDPEQITKWWTKHPAANIGCPCGPAAGFTNSDGRQGYGSDHDAIDIEPDGIETARSRNDQATWAIYGVRTPSGGYHMYVKCRSDVKNAVKPLQGIDVRTAGGYTLLPPSFVVDEDKGYEGWYTWLREPWGDGVNLPELPEMPHWIVDAANKKASGSRASLDSLDLTEGSRNKELFRYGCRLRSEGFEHVEIEAALRSINTQRCKPPLSDKEIETLSKSASKYKPGTAARVAVEIQERTPSVEVDPESGEIKEFPLTDAGNAERLVHYYGKDLRYCAQWGRWLCWNGWKWESDDTGNAKVHQLALATVRRMQKEAVEAQDSDRRKALGEWGFKCESRSRIENMVSMASRMAGIPVVPSDLDAHPWLINLRNGVYDLKHGELFPHNQSLLLTRGITVDYDPDAKCEKWKQFLLQVLDNDADLLKYVWKATGYSLTGDCSEQCFFFLHGNTGNNGKSTFVETLLALFGDYARQTPTETLMAKMGDAGISNDIARLKDARFVAAPETEDGKRLNEGLIKRLTGGDTITARFMHQEFFEFKPQFKVWMTGNHRPEIRGTDDAIWRRVALIPFQVTIPKEDRNPHLKEELLDELPGILTWAINGYKAWRENRLGRPGSIAEAVQDYRVSQDKLGAFLDDHTEQDSNFTVKAGELYRSYSQWAKESGEYPMSLTKFGNAMRERGEGSVEISGSKFYRGRKLKDAQTKDHVYRGSSD